MEKPEMSSPPSPSPFPAFDADQPPEAGLIDDCVHCGFCLPACPTYLLWGEEMDSPRGRIQLMRQGLEGEPLSDTMVSHFDACLGCMACVSACPSGVQYDKLITATRGQVERRYERSQGQRLVREAIFRLFPYPRRLTAVRGPLRTYQRTGLSRLVRRSGVLEHLPRVLQPLAAMEGLAPELDAPHGRLPERVPAQSGGRDGGARRGVVGLLTGCVQSAFFPRVNEATARVLATEGCDVIIPRGQPCCGALSMHSGRGEEARDFAKQTIAAFERAGVDAIVVNAAGCGSALKEYGHLLADDPGWSARADRLAGQVRDFSEVLTELGPTAVRHPLPITVAYHDACHLSHAQGVRAQPRSLLSAIPQLSLVEIGEGDICCGSAGVYNLLEPMPARELGDRKAGYVRATQADALVTANPGCLMQIRAGLSRTASDQESVASLTLAHTAEVLDASLQGKGTLSTGLRG